MTVREALMKLPETFEDMPCREMVINSISSHVLKQPAVHISSCNIVSQSLISSFIWPNQYTQYYSRLYDKINVENFNV